MIEDQLTRIPRRAYDTAASHSSGAPA